MENFRVSFYYAIYNENIIIHPNDDLSISDDESFVEKTV